jgi:hypothetical protein
VTVDLRYTARKQEAYYRAAWRITCVRDSPPRPYRKPFLFGGIMKKKKEKLFAGGIPNGDEWNYSGILDGDDNLRYMVYLKDSVNHDGEKTGYTTIKLVLEPGKKSKKGNYWVSVNNETGKIPLSSDFVIMKKHNQTLCDSFLDFIEREII